MATVIRGCACTRLVDFDELSRAVMGGASSNSPSPHHQRRAHPTRLAIEPVAEHRVFFFARRGAPAHDQAATSRSKPSWCFRWWPPHPATHRRCTSPSPCRSPKVAATRATCRRADAGQLRGRQGHRTGWRRHRARRRSPPSRRELRAGRSRWCRSTHRGCTWSYGLFYSAQAVLSRSRAVVRHAASPGRDGAAGATSSVPWLRMNLRAGARARPASRPRRPERGREDGHGAARPRPGGADVRASFGPGSLHSPGRRQQGSDGCCSGRTRHAAGSTTSTPAGRASRSSALDRVTVEPLPWPGHRSARPTPAEPGVYRYEVRDPGGRLLYARGFASIFGEWVTTAEAGTTHRTFHESLRFPVPAGPVDVTVLRRGRRPIVQEGLARPGSSGRIRSWCARRARPGAESPSSRHGAPADKVDLLLIGDGLHGWPSARPSSDPTHDDGRRAFRHEPFAARRSDSTSGACARPSPSRAWRPSPARTDARRWERIRRVRLRALHPDVRQPRPPRRGRLGAVRVIAILVNAEDFNGRWRHLGTFATVAVDNDWADYLFVHEFGHIRRSRRRVLHLTRPLYEPTGRVERTAGSERHGAARRPAAQVARPGQA